MFQARNSIFLLLHCDFLLRFQIEFTILSAEVSLPFVSEDSPSSEGVDLFYHLDNIHFKFSVHSALNICTFPVLCDSLLTAIAITPFWRPTNQLLGFDGT